MRARRIARRVLAVLGFAVLVSLVLSVRPRGSRPGRAGGEVAETLLREATGIRDRMRFRDFAYDESRDRQGSLRLRAAEAIAFSENGEDFFRLKDVTVETRGAADTPTLALSAPRAELNQGSRAVRVFDGVTLRGEGLTIRSEALRYRPEDRTFASEGPVTAVRGRLVGGAERGEVSTGDGRVRLDGHVRFRGRDETGRVVEMASPELVFGRDGSLRAAGGVLVKTEDFLLRSETFSRDAEAPGDRLRAAGAAELLLLPGEGRLGALAVARGDVLDVKRDAGGLPERIALESTAGDSRVDLAPDGRAGARRVLTRRADALLTGGRISEVSFPEPFRAAESVGPAEGGGPRELSSRSARVTFAPEGRGFDVLYLEGDVVGVDGPRARITASRGTVRGGDETAVFTGEPGKPATWADARGAVRAQNLQYARKEGRADASGEVFASYSGDGRGALPGAEAGTPYFSESERLTVFPEARRAVLSGNVKAWQRENVLRCATLTLDAGSLRAEGDVRASLKRRAAPGSKAPDETVTASGDLLTHHEADRTVRVEGRAVLVSGGFQLSADVTDVRLGAERTAEYAEARGTVVIEDRLQHRRGEGKRATWRSQTDVVTLEGEPARAVDGSGNRLAGAVLTFRQGRSRVDVESAPGVGTEGVFRPEGRS